MSHDLPREIRRQNRNLFSTWHCLWHHVRHCYSLLICVGEAAFMCCFNVVTCTIPLARRLLPLHPDLRAAKEIDLTKDLHIGAKGYPARP